MMHGARLAGVRALLVAAMGLGAGQASAASLTQAGTQPGLHYPMEEAATCGGCHGPLAGAASPTAHWAGSMMAHALRDPLFLAALDLANKDIPGVGDFCLRCHTPNGWLAGRSEPPAGSVDGCAMEGSVGQDGGDFEGVGCAACHRLTENPTPPDGQQVRPIGNADFWIADTPCGGRDQACRFGPYAYADSDAAPPHDAQYSAYQRSSDLCGVCHDVTNPAQSLHLDGDDLGIPFPVERTYSEWRASAYSDPNSPWFATCQDCHMAGDTPVPAYVSVFRTHDRSGDLGLHHFAGGSSWMLRTLAARYPNLDTEALENGAQQAERMLHQAATVEIADAEIRDDTLDLTVRVTNRTGHKLPTGYPEGRRMWLAVEVVDASGASLFHSGAYDTESGDLVQDPALREYRIDLGIMDHNGDGACAVYDTDQRHLFHFVLSNCIAVDNRIPPLGFTGGSDPEISPKGHAYPENPDMPGTLVPYDEVHYEVPIPQGADRPLQVTATLWYQSTTAAYVQFLDEETRDAAPDCFAPEDGRTRAAAMRALWETYGKAPPVPMAEDTAILGDTEGANTATDTATGAPSEPGDADADGCGCTAIGATAPSVFSLLL